MREKITVTSHIVVFRLFQTEVYYLCGSFHGTSMKDAVESAIDMGDCGRGTHVILDGRDQGSLWSLGFDPKMADSVLWNRTRQNARITQ